MKYKLLENETIQVRDNCFGGDVWCSLHRIIALKDFGDVRRGDKGGFIEDYDNLSQEGNSWVYDKAKVYDGAEVFGNAQIRDNAEVYGSRTRAYGNAKIFGDAQVGFDIHDRDCPKNSQTHVCGNSQVYGRAHISCGAKILGNAQVFGGAYVVYRNNYTTEIRGDARVDDRFFDNVLHHEEVVCDEIVKYKLLENENIENDGRKLYRIVATKDFGDVHEGDKGGFIESCDNLSQEGNAWVYDNAQVCGSTARVFDDAQVRDNAEVYNAEVYDDAKVFDNASVFCGAQVFGNARVSQNAEVFDLAQVYDNAEVYDNAKVYGADVHGNAKVFGDVKVDGNTEHWRGGVLDEGYIEICEHAQIYGHAFIGLKSKVFGNAQVYDYACVHNAEVYDDAQIYDHADVFVTQAHKNVRIGGENQR